ncbi:MAG: hypothetical protein RLZZ628_4179, partial [Bacteroidota bacterium]
KENITNTADVLDFGVLPNHPRLTVPVTVLKGINTHPERKITLGELLSEIETTDITKLNASQSIVCIYEAYLEKAKANEKSAKEVYDKKKKTLNGFILGNFIQRSDEKRNCVEYVPCLVFDLDGCKSTYDCFLYQNKLKEMDYIFAAFPSPSGYGLRILVWTNSTWETHRIVYQQVIERLCKDLDVTDDRKKGTHFDSTCQNESRHFFYVAVDKKNFYLNLESKTFEKHDKDISQDNKKEQKRDSEKVADIYTYIDVLNDDVKAEFILKSINMNKPRKLQCFDFGCLCKENNVPFEIAKTVALSQFKDSEQKNPENVVITQLKDGYDQTTTCYSDEQFIAFLRNTYHVKITYTHSKNEPPLKKGNIITSKDNNEAEIENLYKKNLKKFKNESRNDFPIEAFPSQTAAIINAFQKAEGYPMDYYGTNALVAISSLLGIAYKAQYRQGHEHFPILYAVLVGDSSAGKSVSAKRFFQPLFDIEKNAAEEYNIKMGIWHQEALSEKEAPPKPKRRELIIDNSTLEALIRAMYHNPRGILYLQEEVLAWIKNMNSYRSGSDEQFWLKNWDSAFVKYNRVSGDIITIANPNATVIGGVQPGVIHQLLNGDKNITGFSARLIFAYPAETKAPYDSDDFPSDEMTNQWQQMITYVDSLPNRIDAGKTYNNIPTVDFVLIKCSTEAKKIYKKAINELTDNINAADNDQLKSIYGKLKSYMMRFALILEVMRSAEEQIKYATWKEMEQHLYIGQNSMEGAYKLMKYYKHNSEKVLQRLETPVDALRDEQQAWYRALPIEGIVWANAINLAKKVGFSERTANRLLNNTSLFKKTGVMYERRIS